MFVRGYLRGLCCSMTQYSSPLEGKLLSPESLEVVNQLLKDGWYGDIVSLIEAAERLANG